jgi:hypothetical protein
MTAGEEMSGTGSVRGLMKKQSIGAERLKTVMLHDDSFAQKEADCQRAKRGARDVDEVRLSKQTN